MLLRLLLIALFLITGCDDSTIPPPSKFVDSMEIPEWLTSSVDHEGFPRALRVRPSVEDTSMMKKYPHLGTLTHNLAKVRADGMPEPDYNAELAEFDNAVHAFLEDNSDGMIMIVETFGGERSYHAGVIDEQTLQRWFAGLSKRFPEHDLSVKFRSDAALSFYRSYRRDFKW